MVFKISFIQMPFLWDYDATHLVGRDVACRISTFLPASRMNDSIALRKVQFLNKNALCVVQIKNKIVFLQKFCSIWNH